LTSQSGKTVTLLGTPAGEEFIHLNGKVEPLASIVVPQDVYTSATARVSSAYPACAGATAGVDEALGGIQAQSDVTVNLPTPITVTGTAMGLALNLQVSQSAPFSGGCSPSLTNSMFITPVFNLTPVTIAAQPTNSANGKAAGVEGLVGSVSANSAGLSVTAFFSTNEGAVPTWQVNLNSGTVFQGVGSASGISAGMPVDMDLVIQPDGSLLATRVAVYDTDATSLNLAFGPPLALYSSGGYQATYPVMDTLEVEQAGDLTELTGLYSISNASFQISGQLANLQSLPFGASFNAANMVDGQNILFTTHGALEIFSAVTTITLLPQTIDGTVSAVSSSGSFTTYTVTLAAYDLFPNLAGQPGQTTLLTNPNTVIVYADSNTQLLNSNPIAVGSLLRLNGLVFNDNGTLRMDCAQISDGVAE
jgi:hypothetical protein